jgi:hypothetical protein
MRFSISCCDNTRELAFFELLNINNGIIPDTTRHVPVIINPFHSKWLSAGNWFEDAVKVDKDSELAFEKLNDEKVNK